MTGNHQLSPWWSPARHADIRPFLVARGAITRAIRAWFDEQEFTEVETGILQVSPGNEIHLHAPRVELTRPDGGRATRYLRTSPEFACKKLLAAGEAKIFEFARVFRDRERGDLHLPEFTILEWYRANAAYDAVMADSVVVIAHAAQATGIGRFSFRGRTADPFAEPPRSSALPGSICCQPSRMARAIAPHWRPRQRRGCGSQMTTPGRTFSARYWSSTSNQIWGRGF
jgi:lysyl-tRNA synthetase class 2